MGLKHWMPEVLISTKERIYIYIYISQHYFNITPSIVQLEQNSEGSATWRQLYECYFTKYMLWIATVGINRANFKMWNNPMGWKHRMPKMLISTTQKIDIGQHHLNMTWKTLQIEHKCMNIIFSNTLLELLLYA